MPAYQPIDMKKKKSESLVIHCSDPRFQQAYRHFIDSLGKYYDLKVVPGASKAIVNSQEVRDNIRLLHSLHHFENVHILDHVECGAFGKVSDEISVHSKMLAEAEAKIKELINGINVTVHLLGKNGELTVEPKG